MHGISAVIAWAVAGIVLMIIELNTFTFIFCFIGLGALVTALTTWMHLTPGLSSQLAVFSVSSILTLALFRKTAQKLFAGTNDVKPDYMGEKVKVKNAIPVGGEGSIMYRGSDWIAFSDHTEVINSGSMVEIIAIEGIRVKVKPVAQN